MCAYSFCFISDGAPHSVADSEPSYPTSGSPMLEGGGGGGGGVAVNSFFFLGGERGGGDEKQGGNCGREPPNTSHGNDSATPPATGQDRQRCRNKERRMSSPHPTPDPIHAGRLARLRAVLKARGLDGFVIPTSDEHMSEYVGADAQRLA